MNSTTASDATTQTTRKRKSRLATAWELPALIRPLPIRQRGSANKQPRTLPHYAAIVQFVYENRFATRFQIQRRFAHVINTDRTARHQIANIVSLGYLATAPVRSTSPNFPFVYFATSKGIRLVRQTYELECAAWTTPVTEAFRTRGTSLNSLLHELLITEFDLALWQTVEQLRNVERLFVERRFFHRDKQLRYEHNGANRRVAPDSGFLLKTSPAELAGSALSKPSLLMHFTELDNGTMQPSRIREKYDRYDAWARSADGKDYLTSLYARYGQHTAKPTFRLLMIVHAKNDPAGDERRLVDLFTQALDLPAAMRDRIWFTTVEQLRQHQYDFSPLSASIWLRARDTKPWRQFVDLGQYKTRRAILEDQLSNLPSHPLISCAIAAKAAPPLFPLQFWRPLHSKELDERNRGD